MKASFRRVFSQHADSKDLLLSSAGYENIPIGVHVPVLDLPWLPDKDTTRVLSKAVIQGTLTAGRRDFASFFADLVQSLNGALLLRCKGSKSNVSLLVDPSSWGYLHPLHGHKAFIPDHRSSASPFELALVGAGSIEIPEELAYMVTVHHDLDYDNFYRLIANMDIVVPAFADFGCKYYSQASLRRSCSYAKITRIKQAQQ